MAGAIVAAPRVVAGHFTVGIGIVKQAGEIDKIALGVFRVLPLLQEAGLAHNFIDRAIPELGQELADLFRHSVEIVDDIFRFALEFGPQFAVR